MKMRVERKVKKREVSSKEERSNSNFELNRTRTRTNPSKRMRQWWTHQEMQGFHKTNPKLSTAFLYRLRTARLLCAERSSEDE